MIFQRTHCKNSRNCPEQRLKNSYTSNKIHSTIGKQSPNFKFSHNFHHPPVSSFPLFFLVFLLSFSLLFIYCQVNIFSLFFFFRHSLNRVNFKKEKYFYFTLYFAIFHYDRKYLATTVVISRYHTVWLTNTSEAISGFWKMWDYPTLSDFKQKRKIQCLSS